MCTQPLQLVVWCAKALWHLELADRTVLYVCRHRSDPSDDYHSVWKGEHGELQGKETVLSRFSL